MKKMLLMSAFLLITSSIVTSCKKDEEQKPTPNGPNLTSVSNYSKLKSGNYWVYQRFNNDGTPTAIYDSCYVSGDTLINGKNYVKFVKPSFTNPNIYELSFQRDSLDYLIDEKGKILFSPSDKVTLFENFVELFNATDTIDRVITKMDDPIETVTVPAGTFATLNAKTTYYMYPDFQQSGAIRVRNKRYAAGVGIVVETLPLYLATSNYTERRLVRYHINE
jgi:hypothetical protein